MSSHPAADSNVIDGSYIVVYKDSVASVGSATDKREQALGFRATHRYRSALQGFSAKLSDSQVWALENDRGVSFVQADRTASATGWVPRAVGEPVAPTGIRRIVAAKGTDVRQKAIHNVAVIDTGINLSHPDLNAVDGTDCVAPGTPAEDENGHGTHVSGTIGAKNNGSGVVGVAPSTRIYAVRVLNASGSGSFSQIICGLDWVSANAASKDIEVANMSLGGTLGGTAVRLPGHLGRIPPGGLQSDRRGHQRELGGRGWQQRVRLRFRAQPGRTGRLQGGADHDRGVRQRRQARRHRADPELPDG